MCIRDRLCGLTYSDVFLDEGYLHVWGKGRKERLVPMSPKAVSDVQRYQMCIRDRSSPACVAPHTILGCKSRT